MNRIYKVIFSETRKGWVVVSELVTGHSKSPGRRAARLALVGAAVLSLTAGMSAPTWANYSAPLNEWKYVPEVNQNCYIGASAGPGYNNIAIGQFSSAGRSSEYDTEQARHEALFAKISSVYSNIYDVFNDLTKAIDQGGEGMNAAQAQARMDFEVWRNWWKLEGGDPEGFNSSDYSTAVGYGARAEGAGQTAIGAWSWAKGKNTMALGVGSVASGDNSITIGYSGVSGGENSTAIGFESAASGKNSVTLGMQSAASDTNGISIGMLSSSEGSDSIVVGAQGQAKGSNNIVLGQQAFAGVAERDNGHVTLDNSTGRVKLSGSVSNTVSIGGQAEAEASGSVAIGQSIMITRNATNSVAIGQNTQVDAFESVAVGHSIRIYEGSRHSVALGPQAYVYGNSENSIAIGQNSQVGAGYTNHYDDDGQSPSSIAIGEAAHVEKYSPRSIAIGQASRITHDAGDSTALGQWSQVKSQNGTALGAASLVDENSPYSMALGQWSRVKTPNSTALGQGTLIAESWKKQDIEYIKNDPNQPPTPYGKFWVETDSTEEYQTGNSSNNTAVGQGASIAGNNNLALGAGSSVSGKKTTVIPTWNLSDDNHRDDLRHWYNGAYPYTTSYKEATPHVLASEEVASANNSTAVGQNSAVYGNNNTALGEGSWISGTAPGPGSMGTLVYENNGSYPRDAHYEKTVGTVTDSTAVGRNSKVYGSNSTALGANTSIGVYDKEVMNGTALGVSSSVTESGGVALGANSVASRGVEQYAYGIDLKTGQAHSFSSSNPTAQERSVWAPTSASVSVGNPSQNMTRRITGVAAGSQPTDAVNVAQLKTAMGASSGATTHYVSIRNIGDDGDNYNNDGASNIGAVAIGQGSKAGGITGLAIGYAPDATGTASIAVGTEAKTQNDYGIAIGRVAHANGVQSIAIGSGIQNGSNGLQNGALARGARTIALGVNSRAGERNDINNYDSIAIGTSARTNWDSAVAVGEGSFADGWYNIALGGDAQAQQMASIAIGGEASTAGEYNIALGRSAKTGDRADAIAFGYTARDYGEDSTAIGYNSIISGGKNNTAVGSNSKIGSGDGSAWSQSGYNNVAVGTYSTAGTWSGYGSETDRHNDLYSNMGEVYGTGQNDIWNAWQNIIREEGIDGDRAAALMDFEVWKRWSNLSWNWQHSDFPSGDYNTALGFGSRAEGAGQTAIGAWAWATGRHATAVGLDSRAETPGAIAIGAGARVYDTDWSKVIPNTQDGYSYLPATNAIAVGTGAKATARDTTTVGRQSQALMPTATAYGNNSHANGQVSIAIGNKAIAGLETDIFNLKYQVDANGHYAMDSDGKYKYEILSVRDPLAGDSSIAIGNRATAVDRSDVAIGTSSYTNGGHSVVVGEHSRATGLYSTAIGGGLALYKILDGESNPEVGNPNTENVRQYGVASVNQAAGDYSTAAGYNNKTVGEASSALGKNNEVSGLDSLAAGTGNRIGAVSYHENRYTLYMEKNSSGDYEILEIKDGKVAGTERTVAELEGNSAIKKVSLLPDSLGEMSGDQWVTTQIISKDQYGNLLFDGNGNPVLTEDGLKFVEKLSADKEITGLVTDEQKDTVTGYAVGTDNEIRSLKAEKKNGSVAENERSFAGAYGHANTVHGDNGYAVGNENTIHGGADDALAFGVGNTVGKDSDDSANEAGKESIAMGKGNTVTGTQSIAVGTGHTVSGNNSGAFGDPSVISSDSSYAVGNNISIGVPGSSEIGRYTFVMGNNVQTTKEGTVVVGHHPEGNEHAFGENSVSLGTDAVASADNSVALGSYSFANRGPQNGGNGAGYDVTTGKKYAGADADEPTWTSTLGAVSVGGTSTDTDGAIGTAATQTRQITGVAAGTADTDAVNVAQLRITAQSFMTHYYSVSPDNTPGSVDDDNYLNTGATGSGAIAAGHYTSAQGVASSAFGNKSVAKGDNSAAVGYNAFAVSNSSSAFGVNTTAVGLNSSAVGYSAHAYGEGAIAFGHEATAGLLVTITSADEGTSKMYMSKVLTVEKDRPGEEGKKDVYVFRGLKEADAEGNTVVAYNTTNGKFYQATPDGNGSFSVGNEPIEVSEVSLDMGGISMGSYAHSEGNRSLAIGRASGAYGKNSTAMGIDSNALGEGGLAIGHGSSTGVKVTVNKGGEDDFWTTEVERDATGNPVANGNDGGIAIGSYAHTEGTRAIAVGRVSGAYGNDSMVVGLRSNAYGEGSMAFGHGVVAGNSKTPYEEDELHDSAQNDHDLDKDVDPTKVVGAIAMGSYAEATGRGSLSVGRFSKAQSAYSTAIGIRAMVSGDAKNSIAIGRETTVTSEDSIVIGKKSTVTGKQSIAVGMGHIVSGSNSGAFGDPIVLSADNSYVVGNSVSVAADAGSSFALANNVAITKARTVVIGNHSEGNAHAFGADSVSLGADAVASSDKSVALGSGSLADAKGGYAEPGTNDVHVGEGLVYSSKQFAGTGGRVIGTVSVGSADHERTITNVAAGLIAENSTEAINGSQLYAVLKSGGGSGGGGGDVISTDNRVVGLRRNENNEQEITSPFIEIYGVKDATADANENSEYAQADSEGAIAIGWRALVEAENGIAVGVKSNAIAKDSVALGTDAQAYSEQSVAIGTSAKAGDKSNPEKSKGAVAIGGQSESTGEFSVAMQSGKATGDYSMAFGENTEADGRAATAFGKGSTASGDYAVAFGNQSHAEAENSLAAIGEGAEVTVSGTVALGSKSIASQTSGVERGESGYDVLTDTNSTETNYVWRSTENAIAVGDAGNSITRKIIGVAAGVDDTDAVNVAQLKLLANSIGPGGSGGPWNLAVEAGDVKKVNAGDTVRLVVDQPEGTRLLELKETDPNDKGEREVAWVVAEAPTFGGNVTAYSFTVHADSGDVVINKGGLNMGGNKITNVAPGDVNKNSTEAVTGGQVYNLGDSIAQSFGGTSVYNPSTGKVDFHVRLDELDKEYDNVADALNALDTKPVYKHNITMEKDLTVGGTFTAKGPSHFHDTVYMHGNKITGLAPGDIGPDSTDAVNGSQLYALEQNIHNEFNNWDNKLRKGLAHVGSRAAALAALHPLDYDPDKPTSIMAGIGHYKGDSTVALGVAHHFNDDTLLTVGSTIGHDTMVNVGLSLRLGRNTNMTEKRWKVQRHTAVDYDAKLKVLEAKYNDLKLDKEAEISGLRQRLQFLEEDLATMRGRRGAKR